MRALNLLYEVCMTKILIVSTHSRQTVVVLNLVKQIQGTQSLQQRKDSQLAVQIEKTNSWERWMQIMTSEERIFPVNNMAEHINSITSIFFLLSFTKKVLFFFFNWLFKYSIQASMTDLRSREASDPPPNNITLLATKWK